MNPPTSLVSTRDVVVCRRWKKIENGYELVMKSIKHKDAPEVDGIVRANMLIQAVKAIKIDSNKTSLSLMNQIDIGGWVPTYVVNMLQRRMPQMMSVQL